MADQIYQLHHTCIYDTDPRESMWPFLRWSHTLLAHFWEAADMMQTGEGHVDYYFLGCGSQFYLQFESPPFQFAYENDWYARHGRSFNHITWLAESAQDSFEALTSAGADVVFPFSEFGESYSGHVVLDPEGRWVEVMTLGEGFGFPDLIAKPTGPSGLQIAGPKALVSDVEATAAWYERHLGMRIVHRSSARDLVLLADSEEVADRSICLTLCTPSKPEERAIYDARGFVIAGLVYEADDAEGAYEEALAAGLGSLSAPEPDDRTGLVTAALREPNGNVIEVRARTTA